jgi:hypothetical protein
MQFAGILARDDVRQVMRRLGDAGWRMQVYIHIDKKSDTAPFYAALRNRGNVQAA